MNICKCESGDGHYLLVDGVRLNLHQGGNGLELSLDEYNLAPLAKKIGLTACQIVLFSIPVFGWLAAWYCDFSDIRHDNAVNRLHEIWDANNIPHAFDDRNFLSTYLTYR